MLSRIRLGAKDYPKMVVFYTQTLKVLYGEDLSITRSTYSPVTYTDFRDRSQVTLRIIDLSHELMGSGLESYGPPTGFHLVLKADTKEAIRAWHAKALELGGLDDTPSDPALMYGSGFYGAFAIDPEGHRLQVVLA